MATVIGREVSVPRLQEAAGLSADELRLRLGRLQSGEFLYATRFGAEAEYAFKHALTHEVAYTNVPEHARALLHARVLTALLKLAPDTRERRPEMLAHHATAAGRHGEAIDYWFRAGQLAIKRSAHGDAIVHLTDAALAVIADALEQARETEEHAFVAVHLRLRGEALLQRGDPAGAGRAFRDAVEIASGRGAWLFALRAACSLARLDARTLDVLETITRRFPDTLDSSDLRTARALLGRA